MVSADAGIWLAFFRNETSASLLRQLLQEERIAVHPFVLMQLRLRLRGPDRARILADLEYLVACKIDPPEAVSAFIEERDLATCHIDLVGAHLLASAARHGDELWASARGLHAAALELKVAFVPSGVYSRRAQSASTSSTGRRSRAATRPLAASDDDGLQCPAVPL